MIVITNDIILSDQEYSLTAVTSQGPGGQNVNRVCTAVQLRFNITKSSLPDFYKERLLNISDSRITKDGEIVIKAQNYRSQNQNIQDAKERLKNLILDAVKTKKSRKATKPTLASRKRKREQKTKRGEIKKMRRRITL